MSKQRLHSEREATITAYQMTSVPSLHGVRMSQCKEDKQQEKDKEVRSDRGREQGQERAEKYQKALQTEK